LFALVTSFAFASSNDSRMTPDFVGETTLYNPPLPDTVAISDNSISLFCPKTIEFF
jgi:hypothetical protein